MKTLGITITTIFLPFSACSMHGGMRKSETLVLVPFTQPAACWNDQVRSIGCHSDSSVRAIPVMMSWGLVPFCWIHQTRCSASHIAWFTSCKKYRHALDHKVKQDWVFSIVPCKGLYLTLAKVTLVSSCKNLSVADCSWQSIFKKFRVNMHGLRHYVSIKA